MSDEGWGTKRNPSTQLVSDNYPRVSKGGRVAVAVLLSSSKATDVPRLVATVRKPKCGEGRVRWRSYTGCWGHFR